MDSLSRHSLAQAPSCHSLSVQEPRDGFMSLKQRPFDKHQAGEPSLCRPQHALWPDPPPLHGLSDRETVPSGK